jgi:hypothetical protein
MGVADDIGRMLDWVGISAAETRFDNFHSALVMTLRHRQDSYAASGHSSSLFHECPHPTAGFIRNAKGVLRSSVGIAPIVTVIPIRDVVADLGFGDEPEHLSSMQLYSVAAFIALLLSV